MTVDTSAEAVELRAARMDAAAQAYKERASCCGEVCSAGVCAAPACHFGEVMGGLQDGAATLRALAAERDAARRAAAAQADTLGVQMRAVEAERDAARAERDDERAALNRAIDLRAQHIAGLAAALDRAEAKRDAARAEAQRLREALQRIAGADFNCTAQQMWMLMRGAALAALAAEPQP